MVDDVWTVATWDAIRSKLPDDNNGSRIIVTTRIETVAEACSNDKDCIHRIAYLSSGDSKKLFLSRAFGSKDAPYPLGLEEEMGKILNKCGGLPMAIISIAGLLASYKSSESEDMWERVRKSIGSHMESHPTLEGMKQIVTLSFNHLHYYLKGCMMYFGIFPEDYIIVKIRLLKRWIAEGLVAEVRGLTLMEVAEAYYDELVSRSMIDRSCEIVCHRDGRMETCRVHDMVLEVMVSKSLEANFVSLVGGPYSRMSYGSIRRLSIHGGEVEASVDSPSNNIAASHSRKNDTEGMKLEHVRSLSMFDLEGHTQVLDRLGEFSLLRLLDLEDCIAMENKHLSHVCRMYLLRFLSLRGTSISMMPREVGDLENLETLDVRNTYLDDLPETVSKLEKLEHLHISNKDNWNCWIARRGIGRMKALRTVNEVAFESDADAAEELGELQQLRELRITLKISKDNPSREDLKQKIARSLSRLYSLRWLNVTDFQSNENSLDFLQKLNPPPRFLQHLRISGSITKLPDWVGSLNNLVELVIAYPFFVGDNLFGPVCKLPNLKHMNLEANYYKGKELVAKAAHTFPALKDLYLNFNILEMEVLQFEKGSMAVLEKLHMRIVDGGSKRVIGIEYLTSLKEVVLERKKYNPALDRLVEQLKTLNEYRPKFSQIKVAVLYE